MNLAAEYADDAFGNGICRFKALYSNVHLHSRGAFSSMHMVTYFGFMIQICS